MKKIIVILLFGTMASSSTYAQRLVAEQLPINGAKSLELDFKFASIIKIIASNDNEVRVNVSVDINNNEDNEVFELKSERNGNVLRFYTLTEKWKQIQMQKWRDCHCGYESVINFEIYMPVNLSLEINTINGDIDLPIFPEQNNLYIKTINGFIDLPLEASKNIDIKVSTLNGEIYSDLEFQFPEGKKGLRQVVGKTLRGRLNNGGNQWIMDTINGDVFLRKS